MYIPKIGDYLKILADDEIERYVEMMQSRSSNNCVCNYNIETFNLFDLQLQLINTKPIIKNKLKELLSELKKFKVQSMLVSKYKKRNKIFYPTSKLINSGSDINKPY